MSYRLNSFKGINIGDYYRGYKGDTRSLDSSSYKYIGSSCLLSISGPLLVQVFVGAAETGKQLIAGL